MVAPTGSLSSGARTTTSLYPSQFFSLADMHLPQNIKSLFPYCEKFFYKDPIIGSAVTKLATYPVTSLVYKLKTNNKSDASGADTAANIEQKWKRLMENQLNVRSLLQTAGLDLLTFGNAFISIYVPQSRTLLCSRPGCKGALKIDNTSADSLWDYVSSGSRTEVKFKIHRCPECGMSCETTDIIEIPQNTIKGINFVRWEPTSIDIKYYHILGKSRYFYKVHKDVIKGVRNGDKFYLKNLPKDYLLAIQSNGYVELDPQNLFHFKRPTLASGDMGWGKPLIIHSLQRLFYLNTLRRAQEAIAVSIHINPFTFLFPSTQSGVNVNQELNLVGWMDKVKQEVEHHRKDPNYIAIFPMPIEAGKIGGDGRMIMIGPEIDVGNKEVTAGMGVPLEFIFGGLSWAGTSVSMRMLENALIDHRHGLQRLLDFVVECLGRITNLPECEVTLTELRMADDIQRQQLALQINASNKLSDKTFMSEVGFDSKSESDIIESEMETRDRISQKQMIGQAKASGEASVVNSRYSAKAQIENQITLSQASTQLMTAMPYIDAESEKINKVLNYMQLMLTYQQMMGIIPPPPPEGGPPPDQGGGAPPEGPPPEQGPPPEGAPMSPQDAEAGMAPQEGPLVQNAQQQNEFYQPPTGPDVDRQLKIWATKLSRMAPGDRANMLADIQRRVPMVHQKIMAYLALIPPGGTASDAQQVMAPMPENRAPRRGGSF